MDSDKMLFIIRQNGLDSHIDIVDYVLNILKKYNYKVLESGLINVIDVNKMVTKFYDDKMKNEKIKNTIIKANGNKLFYIITNYDNYKKCSKCIKKKIRRKYPNKLNKWINYFHSSDSPNDAEKEISILKDSNELTFNNIGSTYKQIAKRNIL